MIGARGDRLQAHGAELPDRAEQRRPGLTGAGARHPGARATRSTGGALGRQLQPIVALHGQQQIATFTHLQGAARAAPLQPLATPAP